MNINRSYLRGAIIAIVVMIGTISAAYADPTTPFTVSGSIFYGNYSECNNSTVNIANLNTSGAWVANTSESSNHYQMVLDSDNVSANNTLRFSVLSLDESQSSVTEHVVTSEEMGDGGFVYNITLAEPADTTPPVIYLVDVNPAVVAPGESITVTVNVTDDESDVVNVTANGDELAFDNGTWEGTITAESAADVYNVTVVATDAAGNLAEDNKTTYTVVKPDDTTPPVIYLVDVNPAVVAPGESITVTVNVTDDESDVVNVTANGDELAFDNGTWEGTITAESAADVYNVTVVATDAAGNLAEDNKTTYTVVKPDDTTPPVIYLVDVNPAVVAPSGAITVTVNVTDAESDVVNVTANGDELAFDNGTWEGTITAESAADVYNVTVVATDAAGNLAEDNKTTYTVVKPDDTTPPVIYLVDVNPAVVAPSGAITVTVNVTDAESDVVNVTANGDELAFDNGTWEGTITAESTADTYNVTVVATDAAGNVAEDNKTTYEVQEPDDTTPPVINLVDVNPAVVAPSGAITVTVNVTDAESDVVNVTANGDELAFDNGTWEGTITAESTADTYNVTVVATDAAGNVAEDNKTTYEVQEPDDTTPPVINLVDVNPAVVAPSGAITVTVNVTDAESDVVNVTANGDELAFDNGTWEGTITAESTADTYNVTVVATDAAGNVAEDNKTTYEVQEPDDTTPPVINLVDVNPAVVAPNEPITVTVNVTDASGIASVTADNVSLTDAENGTWTGTIPAKNTSGVHNVTVVATDNSTNSNNVTDDSATYTVTVPGDTTPPVINLVDVNPAVVAPNEPITVTVNVTDASGIASVTADNVSLTDAENGTWTGTIPAKNTSGVHNVTVVATDNSTNSNNVTDDSATYTVTVPGDTTPPVIHSVELNRTDVAPNEPITVTVNVTDAESDVANVTANGDELAFDNGTWEGVITAESAVGTHNVTVVATDAAGNVAKDNETTYEVQEPVPPATLSIEDVAIRRGENKTVPIKVFDVVNMGGCEIKFTYDPAVVYVTDVARGDLNFSFKYNINNGSGWMRANALDAYGQSGNVTFAYLTLAAVGNKSDTSEMEFEDSRLLDASYTNITHIRDNGTFSILPNVLPVVTNVSANPNTILYDNGRPRTPGTNITSLSAHVTDTDGSITAVTINLSSIGRSPAQPMEHVSGDVWAVTTNATEVAINAPDFTHQLAITATDDDGGINDSVSIELTVLKRGDVNGDGFVDKADADYISRYLAGLEPEASNPPVVLAGDVIGNAGDPMGNGVVDLMDALYIARYTSNMEGEP